jgi:hypothetical protein
MPYDTVSPTCYVCFGNIVDEWALDICELDEGELSHFECACAELDCLGDLPDRVKAPTPTVFARNPEARPPSLEALAAWLGVAL